MFVSPNRRRCGSHCRNCQQLNTQGCSQILCVSKAELFCQRQEASCHKRHPERERAIASGFFHKEDTDTKVGHSSRNYQLYPQLSYPQGGVQDKGKLECCITLSWQQHLWTVNLTFCLVYHDRALQITQGHCNHSNHLEFQKVFGC